MNKLLVFFFLLSTIFSFQYPQKTINKYNLYSKEELISDLDFLVKTIEDVHPAIYTVIDSIKFEQEKKRIVGSLSDSLNSLDYFKLISPLIAKIGDAHTLDVLPWDE